MDVKLSEVFDSEFTRDNDGTYLDGDTVCDSIWRELYKSIITFQLSQHDIPSSPTGQSFVKFLSNELRGVMDVKWNIDNPLCFMALALQTSPDVKGSTNVRKRIKNKLLEWEEDKHRMLTTCAILCAETIMKRKWGSNKPAERDNFFTSLA